MIRQPTNPAGADSLVPARWLSLLRAVWLLLAALALTALFVAGIDLRYRELSSGVRRAVRRQRMKFAGCSFAVENCTSMSKVLVLPAANSSEVPPTRYSVA